MAAVAAAALVAASAITVPAQADTIGARTTFNRPSTVEAGGVEYVTWADPNSSGYVHVAMIDKAGNILASWYDGTSSTYPGTGPTIASVQGLGIVVAWTDASGEIWLAALVNNQFPAAAFVSGSRGWARRR